MADRMQGQVVVVTGGSRGIGRAIVERLVEEGARVSFTFLRHSEAAEAVKARLPGVEALACDGRDPEAVQRALESVLEREGRIDALVNNAGVTHSGLLAMTPGEDLDRVIRTNLAGTIHWCRAVLRPMLQARRGAILNVGSVSGSFGLPGQAAYGASKGAILALTRSLAAETVGKGIRVNALVPGFIDTEMTAVMPSPSRRAFQDRIPMRRFGLAREVAHAALFLLSDEASYITGQALVVDGGLSSLLV
ncbi:SDR family oxidoreductase [Myxococcota bacterium]|nr:SDR family oxidoreductase [Myxococcota bacterium]